MLKRLFIFMCLFWGLQNQSSAQVYTFTAQPGSSGTDALTSSNTPTVADGSDTLFAASRSTTSIFRRSLIEFDLSSIPANANIISANLIFYGANHSGANTAQLLVVNSSWAEGTVTWNTLPTTTTTNSLSLSPSVGSTDNYTLNVLSSVQVMVNTPNVNFGWMLRLETESNASNARMTFFSSDCSAANAAKRPRLEITYEIPVIALAYITPSFDNSSTDGAINLDVSLGNAPYTYSWSNGGTTKDIYNVASGVYTVDITDNSGFVTEKIIPVASDYSVTAATLQYSELSLNDCFVTSASLNSTLADQNFNTDNIQARVINGANGWSTTRGFISADLASIPSSAVITSASLCLTTISTPTTTTALYLMPVSAGWNESTITWNNQPDGDIGSASSFSLMNGQTTYSIDVTSQLQSMVTNSTTTNGWLMQLQSEATGTNVADARFYSSTSATVNTRPHVIVTFSLPVIADPGYNWVQTEVFDVNGVVINTSKTYIDALGRSSQQLTKDANNDVFATQVAFDSYGRPAAGSLPAYTGTATTLVHQNHFFQNGFAQPYSYADFDTPVTLNSNNPVQNGLAKTLGYYYSDNNSYDSYQATATNPFARVEFTGDPTGTQRRVSKPGNQFKMGSGHESYSFSMTSGDELKGIYGSGNSFKSVLTSTNHLQSTAISTIGGITAMKQIVMSPDSKESIVYSVGGKVIASCMSGLSTDNCTITSVTNNMSWEGTRSADIHLPDANKSSLTLPLPTYTLSATPYTVSTSDLSYTITNLYNDAVLTANTDYTLNTSSRAVTFSSGFLLSYSGRSLVLRIAFSYTSTLTNSITAGGGTIPDATVQYNVDYGKWSVSYYDLGGNLRKTVSPKGINCSSPGTITMYSSYDYGSMGELISKQTPDEGLVEFNYDSEGKLRFSQNADQKTGNRFSYCSYDTLGRKIQVGEYTTGATTGTLNVYFENYYNNYSAPNIFNIPTTSIVNQQSGLALTGQCSDVSYISYTAPTGSDDIPSAYTYSAQYRGKYLQGAVCRTWNANTSTWYNYDDHGRLSATVKQIYDSDFTGINTSVDDQIKTSQVTYDNYNSTVSSGTFQANASAEKLVMSMTYDANLRPSALALTPPGSGSVQAASLSYNKLGLMKRMVLGNMLQGLDYTYTIDGRLKAINHPGLDYTLDPGADNDDFSGTSPSGTVANKDLFGEMIDYHYQDYERTGSNMAGSITSGNSKYDGLVYATHFKTQNAVNSNTTGANYLDYGTLNTAVITNTNYAQQELMFTYTYDQYKQLATSTFGTYNNSTMSFTPRSEYSESGAAGGNIGYDANGNITRLVRAATNSVTFDDLTYTISTGGNQVSQILDAAVNSFSSSVNFRTSSTVTPQSFSYNAVGQMTASAAENVSSITYYTYGKVKQITFGSGDYTEYFYDDTDNEYKKIFYSAGKRKITWYLGAGIYILDENINPSLIVLQEMNTPTGQLKYNGSSFDVVYAIKDHLGNVRATFKPNGTNNGIDILSYSDYYTMGGVLPGHNWVSDSYRYAYQGQEKAEDGTLWDQFELRLYNHDLGRWFAPDPIGQFFSPYLAMANNPVNMIDPDGGKGEPLDRFGPIEGETSYVSADGTEIYDTNAYEEEEGADPPDWFFNPLLGFPNNEGGSSLLSSSGGNSTVGGAGDNSALYVTPDLRAEELNKIEAQLRADRQKMMDAANAAKQSVKMNSNNNPKTNAVSNTVTYSTGNISIFGPFTSDYGDYYEASMNFSVQKGQQKTINFNTVIQGKKATVDVSLNAGPLRTTLTPKSISQSIGIGNYRYAFSISADGIETISVTYRNDNGFGVTNSFSIRPGLGTLTTAAASAIMFVAPETVPFIAPAFK